MLALVIVIRITQLSKLLLCSKMVTLPTPAFRLKGCHQLLYFDSEYQIDFCFSYNFKYVYS